MARIKPFKSLRPEPKLASKVASLPYDVVSRDEAFELSKGNPFSFYRVVKAEIDFPAEIEESSTKVYKKAKENLDRMIKNKILVQDSKASFYIYRQKMGNHVQTGIVACVDIDEYVSSLIKKHELTRKDKEQDRTRHVQALQANTGPVFLTYRKKDDIDKVVNDITSSAPAVLFISEDKVTHECWVVDNDDVIDELIKLFKSVPSLYVADGHHRLASAANVAEICRKKVKDYTGEEEFNFAMTVIFPHDRMQILPYNRVVKDTGCFTKDEFLAKLAQEFDISDVKEKRPLKKGRFAMYFDKGWYLLRPRDTEDKIMDVVEELDVSIFQEKVLSKILGITDPRIDNRLGFIGGIKGEAKLEELVDSGEYKVAFSFFPTSIDELLSVADAGGIMPPKSTWFEPKLRSGLFIHMLNGRPNK